MLCCVRTKCCMDNIANETGSLHKAIRNGAGMDGVSQVSGLSDQLRQGASKGQLRQVEDCLKAGATFNVDQDGRTALHYAALNGFVDVTKFLIEKGCNINIQDDSGYTALHRAASQGHLEVIQVLLQAGCDVNTQDEHGNAAIHEAAWNGFSKTLELLVKYDVNVVVINKAGFTALHLAAQNGHNESSRVLLYAGCNNDNRNNYGDTALHTAARYGHAGVTRILISARAKLNEQNKNGDTALHISAALKRRKIAKLLVDSGTDVTVRNKQNENAADVARRKDHHEIIAIIQAAYTIKGKEPKVWRAPAREVMFKEDMMHEIDGPIVVPDQDLPGKQDAKQEKGKKFFFFKKKKTKEKEKEKQGGVTQQKPVPSCSVHVGKTPVQGFFSKYVPREGVQYYRDLAGNVKKGPVGYTPQCNCLPAMHQLEKKVNDTTDHIYGQMHTQQQVMHERIDKLDQRSSLRVQSLEKYTRDRFVEEEHLCQQRINEGHENHYMSPNNEMKVQIQDWLEEKLEGYGHCLHHHHDDSVLPNENIFSDVHETANGRLFKSRSDETLSQSDNHSGKFRKRDFYESRTEAMQQMRAWQVPSYSKDRNKVQIRQDPQRPRRSQSKQQLKSQPDTRRYQPLEPEIEVRHQARGQEQQFTKSSQNDNQMYQDKDKDSAYVMMNTFQHGAIPKQTQGLPKSQSYQSNQRPRGPVTHSTPKSAALAGYESVGGLTRSHTDAGITNRLHSDSLQTPVNSDNVTNFKPKLPDRPVTGVQQGSNRQLVFLTSEQQYSSPVSSTPMKSSPSSANTLHNSISSDKYASDMLPKPTFTTFGYDGDSPDGCQAAANSVNQRTERSEGGQSSSTPRLNSDLSFPSSHSQHSPLVHSNVGLHESQNSLGFVPTHADDNYVDMSYAPRSQRLHQRARSAEGLLDDDGGFRERNRNVQGVYSAGPVQSLDSTRSSSVPRSAISFSSSGSPGSNSLPQPQVKPEQNSYPSTSSHSIYSANSSSISPDRYRSGRVPPPTSPKPKNNPLAYNPYSSVREVQGSSSQYRGSPIAPRNTEHVNSAKENVYSATIDVKLPTDRNHNITVKADVHASNMYLSHNNVGNRTNVNTVNQSEVRQQPVLEPRSQTAYQTYLTEDLQVQSGNMFKRENSPNACNNSKEDSSSNPDSGYSSKIYGNRASSVTPVSTNSTPSSSFSTDRGISLPSNNNSPQSQYSNGDYESLPKKQYYDEVQSHMHNWYQRKLQETTQKVYDSWQQSPPRKNIQNGGSQLPVKNYGKDDYAKIPYEYSQGVRTGQSSGQIYGDYNGLSSYARNNPTSSHIAIHGSDV